MPNPSIARKVVKMEKQLPSLQGSEKQVEWASIIRCEFWSMLNAYKICGGYKEKPEKIIKKAEKVLKKLTSAKGWISVGKNRVLREDPDYFCAEFEDYVRELKFYLDDLINPNDPFIAD